MTRSESFKTLRRGFVAFKKLVESSARPISGRIFRAFYEDNIEEQFKNDRWINAALFDVSKYPSLFTELPIHERQDLQKINLDYLPTEWTKEALTESAKANDLARFLIACLWKSSQYGRVSHILNGLRSPAQYDYGSPATYRQFGRHLADPHSHPLFDQHTGRFLTVYRRIHQRTEYSRFLEFFDEDINSATGKSPSDHVRCEWYVNWWAENIHLPPKARKTKKNKYDYKADKARCNAILWSDRIMFSLGKAAGLVRPPKT